MFNDKYSEDFYDIVKKDPKKYYEDFQNSLEKRSEYGATYKKNPVPTLYQPFYYNDKVEKEFQEIIDIFMSIAKKVTKNYVEDPSYRKLFDIDPLTEKLILKDPGYDIDIPISRIDIFYDGPGEFKFCEVNTDGTSDMLGDLALARMHKESKIYQEFTKIYDLEKKDALQGIVDSILDLYYSQVSKEDPNVAIVDIISFDNIEFREIKRLFEEKGLKTEIVDVRDLKRKDGKLYAGDMRVDLVYRRLVTSDLIAHKEEAKEFIDSYLAGEFTSVGSLRTSLFYTKDIFRTLRLEETKEILTEEEYQFILDYIPFTDTYDPSLKEEILENKDDYILKPKEGYASSGVFIGKEMPKEEFSKKLDKIENQAYIYQEFYEVEPMKYLTFKGENEAKLEDYRTVTGLFSFNNKLASPYMKVGQAANVSYTGDYYILPSFKVKEK